MVNTTAKKPLVLPKKKNFLPVYILVICITSFTLYYRSLNNDFLDLDDMTIIVKNYPFLKSLSNATQAFRQGVFQIQGIKDTLPSYYRPIMTLSFMVDAHISPSATDIPKPKPFLAANIFYHTIACILLLLLLLELNIPPLTSFLLSLIFTVHPLLNQAVAWIPGRNDSLLAIFILGAFLFLVKYVVVRRQWLFVLHALFFLLALFTKENAIMLVPLSFLFLSIFSATKTLRHQETPGKPLYIKLGLVYLLCIIPWFLLRQHALAANSSNFQLSTFNFQFLSNLLHNSPYFLQYAGNAILPFSLSVMSTPADTNYILAFAGIAIVFAGLFFSKTKPQTPKGALSSAIQSPIIQSPFGGLGLAFFGIMWFIFFLTPSLFSTFSGLEHRAYVPMIGVILVISQINWLSKIGFGLLAGVFILFFSVSVSHLHIYENRFNFDKSAMETSPKSVLPCLYLAKHYEEEREYDSAINAYREALKRDSNAPMVRNNIGGDYILMKDYTDAEKELRTDMAMHPKSAITVFDLGLVILQSSFPAPPEEARHKDSEAVALWKKSLKLDSGFVKPYNVLSQYYQAMGDSDNTRLYRNLYRKKTETN